MGPLRGRSCPRGLLKRGLAEGGRKTSCGRKRRERLPVDILGQDHSKICLIRLMIAGHWPHPFFSWRARVCRHGVNFASKVIAALRTLDTGQFFSASPARLANAASSRFGTFARKVSAERLMRNACPA